MTTCKGVVCPISEINYSKCEVSSDSELCSLNLSSVPPHICAAYTFSLNIGTVTNEAWQHESTELELLFMMTLIYYEIMLELD